MSKLSSLIASSLSVFTLFFLVPIIGMMHGHVFAQAENQFSHEIWQYFNSESRRKSEPPLKKEKQQPVLGVPNIVRVVYLVPSDKNVREDYRQAVSNAILSVQDFYLREIGIDETFTLASPGRVLNECC